MKALNALSAMYLASASVFGVAIALKSNPDWTDAAGRAAQALWPTLQQVADTANERVMKPAIDAAVRADTRFFDAIDPPRPMVAVAKPPVKIAVTKPAPLARPAPQILVHPVPLPLRPAIIEEQPPRLAKVAPAAPAASAQTATLVPQAPKAPEIVPAPDASGPGPAELTRVMERLKLSLTQEMLANFKLFLYVSKADKGPWSQRMYVFREEESGDLDLLYNWPVSTGREVLTPGPSGRLLETHTPDGYYQLDPDRMYTHHFSGEWHQPMPHSMFFNWIKDGNQTGLAIHGAPDEDIALLGKRASAGCVRLAPQNATLLFQMIRAEYRGLAPKFAYDRRTATMSNQGVLLHDANGHIQLAEGYKVLVFIENYGGDNVVAALF